MAKTAKRKTKQDGGRVTFKLGPKCMLACRKAAKQANKQCDGSVPKQAAYFIASIARGTAPATPEDRKLYTHGLVNPSMQFGKQFAKDYSMTCYVHADKKTYSSAGVFRNDIDRLVNELEQLGVVRRWGNKVIWANMKTPAERTVNDSDAIAEQNALIAAIFSDEDNAKPATRRKIKKCDECGKPLAKCICETEDEDDEDDPTVEDEDIDEDDEDDDEMEDD